MTKVIYLRHGQSVRNVEGVFAGGNDNTPLTDYGRLQAKQAGQLLKEEKIECIISSPLDRTIDTATIVAKEIGFKGDILIDKRFQEYDIGDGNGKNVEGMTAKQMISFTGAEIPIEFQNRVIAALTDLTRRPENVILVVAHGGVGRIIECTRQGVDPDKFYDVPGYPNAEPIILDLSWLG